MNPDRLAGLLTMLLEDGHITPQAARLLTLTNDADRHRLVAELTRGQREDSTSGGYTGGYGKVDSAQLKALEDLLYGSEAGEPSLPPPDAVLAMFRADGYSAALHEAAQRIGDPDPHHLHCDCP